MNSFKPLPICILAVMALVLAGCDKPESAPTPPPVVEINQQEAQAEVEAEFGSVENLVEEIEAETDVIDYLELDAAPETSTETLSSGDTAEPLEVEIEVETSTTTPAPVVATPEPVVAQPEPTPVVAEPEPAYEEKPDSRRSRAS